MNKKSVIIIIVSVVIALIVLGVMLYVEKETNEKKENIYSYHILTEEERKNNRLENIEKIADLLKEGGLSVKDKKECQSLFLSEEGYSYNINNQTIEIYELDNMKLESMIERVKNNNVEVTIKTQTKLPINAICFDNTLILNSKDDVKQKIMQILAQGHKNIGI